MQEIERKFLVKGDEWRSLGKGIAYRQGYLSTVKKRVVRVRNIDNKGFLTIKGTATGATRLEYEYEISVQDANEILDELCERHLGFKEKKGNAFVIVGRISLFSMLKETIKAKFSRRKSRK